MPPVEGEPVRSPALPASVSHRRAAPAVPTGGEVVLGILGKTVTVSRAVVVRVPGSAALGRLPVPSPVTRVLRRGWLRAGRRGRIDGAALVELVERVADVVVPRVVREVLARLDVAALIQEFVDVDRIAALLDVEAVLDRVDVDEVVRGVDLDAIIERIDMDKVLDRLDLDAIVDRVDLDRIAARLDLDAVIDRVDVDRVAARLDLDAVIDRVDVDRVAARLDLDAVIDRVDVDRVAARLDIDVVLDRMDLIGLAEYVVDGVDLPGIIRSSTGSMTTEVVDGVRAQGAGADRAVERLVDRLLLRHQARRTALARAQDDPAEAPAPAGGHVPTEHPAP